MISMIAAMGKNRVIGNKNKLPWDMPTDLNYFRQKTLGKTIVMGHKTFESVGSRPLPKRKNIILSNNPNATVPEGCFLARSINEVLEMIKNPHNQNVGAGASEQEVMICGGASVYKQFLPLADRLYLTYIDEEFEGDTYFPEFDTSDWKEVSREDHRPDEKNKYNYSFVLLERKR